MKTKMIIAILCCTIAVIACRKKEAMKESLTEVMSLCKVKVEEEKPTARKEEVMTEDRVRSTVRFTPPEIQNTQKLIKKGYMTLSTPKIEEAKAHIYQLLKFSNGYVSNELLNTEDSVTYYEITLNIPCSGFDRYVELLDSTRFKVLSRSFSVVDVTSQYTDDSARLSSKRKMVHRYLELLNRAIKMTDIIEIEDKVEEIQSDIESKESELKSMEKQIAYSELHLRIVQQQTTKPKVVTNIFGKEVVDGLVHGWKYIKSLFLFLISIWPIYFALFMVYIGIRQFRKRNKK